MLSASPGPDGDANDQICEPADVLADGQSLDGFIGNALGILDVDLFKLNIQTIQKDFVFTVNATGNLSLDPYLRLFDGNGNPLASNDNGGSGDNARISYNFTSFGTHYLGVSTNDNEDYSVVTGEGDSQGGDSTIGAYTVTFEDSTDQISETVLFLSTTTTEASGFVDFPTDVTLYRISGEEGSSVRFDVSGSNGLDPFVRVFDSSGDPLPGGSNDDGGPGTDARVTVTFDDTDDFYVGVSSFQNTNYDADDGTGDSSTATNTGAYEITATEVSLDPNDRIANAFNLGNLFVDGTRTSSGNIDNVADVDLFRFEVGRAGSFVEIDVDRPVTGVDSFLRIFDADGNPLASNDDANAPGESGAFARDSFLGLELAAGVYYAGVSAVDNRTYDANTGLDDTDGNSTGAYTIEIQDRLHVDSTGDTNTGTVADNDDINTLREAIAFANDTSGGQTITFQPSVFASGETITLSVPGTNQLEITDSVVIDGPGVNDLAISGNDTSRVFLIDNGNDSTEIDVTIRGLVIRDGNTSANLIGAGESPGAGISNSEDLTLEDVVVRSNRSNPPGGATGSSGGGLSHRLGDLVVNRSTFSGNSALNGGGINVVSGTAEIANSTFEGNTVRLDGGGVRVIGSSAVTIRNSTVVNNQVMDGSEVGFGGGLDGLGGMLTIHNTLVAGNFRGTSINDTDGIASASSHNLISERDSGINPNNGTNGNIVGDGNGGVIPLASIVDEDFDVSGLLANVSVYSLVSNSLGIGAGSNAQAIDADGNLLTTDNDGGPRIIFGTVDIGAIESPFETPSLIVTIPVDTVDDQDGETSLREAVFFANSTPALDTITFAAVLSGETITVSSELPITSSLSIIGPDADLLTISGGTGANRVFNINDGTVSLMDVSISGITITDGGNGTASVFGAGVLNRENLTLDSVSIEDNQAGSGFGGGLQHEIGDLTIRDSTFTGNVATAGGGLRLQSGTADIVNSTISGNSATVNVGGLDTLTPTVLRNVTVTGNRADSDGVGGGNIGGLFGTPGSLELHNTIVAGNFVGTGTTASDISGSSFVAGSSNNLIGSAAGAGGLTDGSNGNIVGNAGSGTIPTLDILNTTLSNNGGPTSTHALLTGSPAIDMGNDALALDADDNPLLTDQRGPGFDRSVGVRADIGAFELQTFNPTPGDYNADLVVNAADYTVWRDTLNATGLTPFSGADGNGDGSVTEADYDVWRGNYGTTFNPPTVSAMTAIPVIETTTDEAADPVRTGFTDPVAREAAFARLPTTQRPSYSVPNRSSRAAGPTVASPRIEDDALLLIATATTAIESEPIEWEAIAGKKDQQPTASTALESAFAAPE